MRTVKELIEKLQTLNPDAIVLIDDAELGLTDFNVDSQKVKESCFPVRIGQEYERG